MLFYFLVIIRYPFHFCEELVLCGSNLSQLFNLNWKLASLSSYFRNFNKAKGPSLCSQIILFFVFHDEWKWKYSTFLLVTKHSTLLCMYIAKREPQKGTSEREWQHRWSLQVFTDLSVYPTTGQNRSHDLCVTATSGDLWHECWCNGVLWRNEDEGWKGSHPNGVTMNQDYHYQEDHYQDCLHCRDLPRSDWVLTEPWKCSANIILMWRLPKKFGSIITPD